MKKLILLALVLLSASSACSPARPERESVTILVAAAASLENCFEDELIPMFSDQFPNVRVDGAYDSSGKLQTQISEGLDADVFVSAAEKNMSALVETGKIDADSVVPLLENRLVLIAPSASNIASGTFDRITETNEIAIGDPDSVPAGQYAKEALENLGLWDTVKDRLSLGTNVTEVLAWVSEGSADAGIVYATDAASTNKVKVLAEAPEGSLKTKIIYPAGIVSASSKSDSAEMFVQFLASDDAMKVFEKYGFSAIQ